MGGGTSPSSSTSSTSTSEAIDLSTSNEGHSVNNVSSNQGSSSSSSQNVNSEDLSMSSSPITQVTSKDHDAAVTGAYIAQHHHPQKKGFWRSLFSCCAPGDAHGGAARNQPRGSQRYSGPLTKTKPVLPPFVSFSF